MESHVLARASVQMLQKPPQKMVLKPSVAFLAELKWSLSEPAGKKKEKKSGILP